MIGNKGVLFMMPVWTAPSELWMQRMIEALEPHLVAIAAYHPTETTWRGKIPSIALRDSGPQFWRYLGRRLHLPITEKPKRTAIEVLRGTVEKSSVSVVLAHYLEFALRFQEVWNNTDKPLFVHCHGYDVTWDIRHHETPETLYFSHNYVEQVRRLSQRAMFIANSQHTADRLLNIDIPPERIRIKPLGVPAPSAPIIRPPKTEGIHILYLGRLVDFKGPDLVIRAFELACQRGLDGYLTIAGDGEMRVTCELLKRNSAFSDRISLLGAVDAELGEKLRARADIFTAHNCTGLLSRQEEGFGVSIVEAMASGLPVVTGRNGSVLETVRESTTGILVQPGDLEAHAEAFLRLGRDPDLRRQMGQAGWERASELFSLVRERELLLDILDLKD